MSVVLILYHLHLFTVLISLLDMMVAANMSHPRSLSLSDKTVLDDLVYDKEDAALVHSINQVAKTLKKRYPTVVDLLLPRCIPYILWLRGHTKVAVQAFMQLADSMEG